MIWVKRVKRIMAVSYTHLLLLLMFQPEKSPGMTLAEPVLPEKSDDLRRQTKQAQFIGNGRLGLSQLVRCLLLCLSLIHI